MDPADRETSMRSDGENCFSCPECGREATREPHRGRAFRCGGCGSWLYRGVWDGAGGRDSCTRCQVPLEGRERCPLCSDINPNLGWFRRVFLRRLSRGLRRSREVVSVPIRRIRADDFQPRLSVDVRRFEGLRRSIEEIGIIHPLLLREGKKKNVYSVISGHRRLLASRQLKWRSVPARILRVTERQALHIRLSENLHCAKKALGRRSSGPLFGGRRRESSGRIAARARPAGDRRLLPRGGDAQARESRFVSAHRNRDVEFRESWGAQPLGTAL